MQIKIYTIPLEGGEAINDEMNKFLRSKKILRVTSHLTPVGQTAVWAYEIRYVDGAEQTKGNFSKKEKVDYEMVLSKEEYARFSEFRTIRKRLATENGVPAYAVFTNEELAEIAKLELRTMENIKSIKGIGENKVEKYAAMFISL